MKDQNKQEQNNAAAIEAENKKTAAATAAAKADELAKESGDATALVGLQMQNGLAIANGEKAFITQLIDGIKADFLAVNEGLALDFVYTASWLIINKKGNFVEKDDETISYGDTIQVVIGQGEQRYMLWGKDNTPEKGQLIVAAPTREDAEVSLDAWLEKNPDRADAYGHGDIGLRYLAYVIPVACLGQDDELPKIYLMSFAPTSSITWGKYAFKVYNGGYKKTLGIPSRTGVNRVVTQLHTIEIDQKGTDNSFIGLEFDALGMFNPEDYGIDMAAAAQAAEDKVAADTAEAAGGATGK